MPTSYSPLLGLALPVTGELAGTWGSVINEYITTYLDSSVAGTQIISGSQTAVTLSITNGATLVQVGAGATGSAQYGIIRCSGNPASLLTITAPAASKSYLVINTTSTNQSVNIVGTGPTTGVTLVSGESAVVAWNGSDFVKVSSSAADGVTSVSGTGTVQGLTLSGTVTSTGSLTLGGSLSAVSLTSQVSGTLPVGNGGTGATTLTGYVYGNGTGAFTAATTIPNAATTATSANTASAIVARDASGNFSAGTITATLSGTATQVSNSVTFNNSGSGAASGNGFNGSSALTVSYNTIGAPSTTGANASGTWNINITGSAGSAPGYLPLSGGTMTGNLTTRTPSAYTAITSVPASTAPIQVPEVNVGSSAGFVPALGQTTVYTSGYRQHLVIGDYRNASAWGGGMFVGLGGNDSYPTEYFLLNYGGSFTHSNGYITIPGSTRSPIFYDSDNTGYFVDANSTSVLNVIRGSTIQHSNGNTAVVLNSGTYLQLVDPSGGIRMYLGNAGDQANYYDNNGHIFRTAGASNVFTINSSGVAQATGDMRAPIFYDSNNTGYYVDPASTSQLNKVYYNSNMVSTNYGIGQVGLYSSVRYQAVFSMGESYILPADGTTTGNLYGIAWSYPSAGGAAANLASHGMLLLENGAFKGAWGGGSFRTPGDVRGTIFYDWDNTGYYVDPASTSNLNVVAVQRAYAGYDAGVTGSFSCNNWFRSSGDTGWYNASYAGGIYMVDTTWVRVYGSKAFYVENQIAATGNVTAYYSDERLKTKVGRIENALDKVRSLEGFLYVNNDLAKANGYTSDKIQVALSAQQVQRVQPEVVSLAPFDMHTDEFSGEITSKSGENYLTVDYERLVPLLVEAIKELSAKVDALQ